MRDREVDMITYRYSIEGIESRQVEGFFVGWPNPPSPETHLRILKNSTEVVLAINDDTGAVVGFVTAVSDGVLTAYIPLLEVLPAYKGRGIGRELMRRMLDRLKTMYMVDLLCDRELQPFYERFDMKRAMGMMIRRYEYQCGMAPVD